MIYLMNSTLYTSFTSSTKKRPGYIKEELLRFLNKFLGLTYSKKFGSFITDIIVKES